MRGRWRCASRVGSDRFPPGLVEPRHGGLPRSAVMRSARRAGDATSGLQVCLGVTWAAASGERRTYVQEPGLAHETRKGRCQARLPCPVSSSVCYLLAACDMRPPPWRCDHPVSPKRLRRPGLCTSFPRHAVVLRCRRCIFMPTLATRHTHCQVTTGCTYLTGLPPRPVHTPGLLLTSGMFMSGSMFSCHFR